MVLGEAVASAPAASVTPRRAAAAFRSAAEIGVPYLERPPRFGPALHRGMPPGGRVVSPTVMGVARIGSHSWSYVYHRRPGLGRLAQEERFD